MKPQLWFEFDENGMPQSIINQANFNPTWDYRNSFAAAFCLFVRGKKCWFFCHAKNVTVGKAQAVAEVAIDNWNQLQHIDLRKFSLYRVEDDDGDGVVTGDETGDEGKNQRG